MRIPQKHRAVFRRLLSTAVLGSCLAGLNIRADLRDGLVSYWPLDEVVGTKTPDLASGYDMELANLTESDLVAGRWGRAFRFENARQTMLRRINAPGEQLPINQHPAFTVSFWAKVKGTGNNDLRMFSEGSTTDNNPLFNLGTANNGNSDQVDFFFRQTSWPTVDHLRSVGEPLDGENWRHIVFVQEADGSRRLFVDAVADEVEIPAKPDGDWQLNTTTIGGILRAAPSFWLNGQLDDVALWKRALAPAEIQSIYANGTPIPFSQPQPLNIRSFASDLPAVAAGGQVMLRWDVTPNVQVEIDQGIGNVTASTVAGVGSLPVTLAASKTFTLKLTRGQETTSQAISVVAIDGVASGWTLVDNFDRYAAGNLGGNGPWFDLTATGFRVAERGENRLVAPNAANVTAFMPLNALTVAEGQARTLFFRVLTTGDPFEAARGIVCLTDRNLRFGGDLAQANGDLGPHAIISDEWGGGDLVGAMNGFQGFVEFAGEPVLDRESVYNVWVDITNGPFPAEDPPADTGDTFSVWVQKEGDSQRTLVIQDYVSNRNPVGDAQLGFTGKDLNKLAIGGRAGQSTQQTILFDDFYLSQSGLLATVPRPYGYSSPISDAPPTLGINRSGAQISVVWSAGTLESAPAVNGPWSAVPGATTSPYTAATTEAARYFRARN